MHLIEYNQTFIKSTKKRTDASARVDQQHREGNVLRLIGKVFYLLHADTTYSQPDQREMRL